MLTFSGKTYVGLKIAQALLTNRNVWNDVDDQSPMLVVCYTNHALDQFLEGKDSLLSLTNKTTWEYGT